MKDYILRIKLNEHQLPCEQCPCLHTDMEFGNEYCAGQSKEPDYPKCLKTCPLEEVRNGTAK